jgi:hypothetical protein
MESCSLLRLDPLLRICLTWRSLMCYSVSLNLCFAPLFPAKRDRLMCWVSVFSRAYLTLCFLSRMERQYLSFCVESSLRSFVLTLIVNRTEALDFIKTERALHLLRIPRVHGCRVKDYREWALFITNCNQESRSSLSERERERERERETAVLFLLENWRDK